MLKISAKLFISIIINLSLACFVYAEGMKVNPGLWETKSEVTSFGGVKENVSQDCIKESEISPEQMMDDATGCEVTDSKSDAGSMQWSIHCENQGVKMTGNGHAKSSGDLITGGMDIKASFSGQEMIMTTKWEGKRIGECK
jgi:hypothetical protein